MKTLKIDLTTLWKIHWSGNGVQSVYADRNKDERWWDCDESLKYIKDLLTIDRFKQNSSNLIQGININVLPVLESNMTTFINAE